MLSFLFPSLLAIGLPLIAVPILLHLLNLRKQNRVEWAAMEFLLQSEQRNRSWVNLKQWLLLAARMLLIAATALMVARPQLVSSLAAWLSADKVHHVVVLDDSYSMSDTSITGANSGSGNAWREAQRVTEHILKAATTSGEHHVSILRSSEVALSGSNPEPDTARGRVELETLTKQSSEWRPSQTAAELAQAISVAARFAESLGPGVPVVGYVVSDCRTKDLQPADPVVTALAEFANHTSAVQLVPTTNAHHENLAVTALRLLPGAKTANLELTAEVAVTNYGPRTTNRVTVRLTSDETTLPAADMGDIPPGETSSRTFPVRFRQSGEHFLSAELEADAVAADNQRFLAISLPSERQVLIVDGSPGTSESLAFTTALNPRTTSTVIRTGWEPVLGQLDDLSNLSAVEEFAAVILLDCPTIPSEAWAALNQYYKSGGGIFISAGKEAKHRDYNRFGLAGSDQPLLPFAMGVTTQAPPASADHKPDLQVTDHPLFKVFAGDRNSFLDLIAVNFHRAAKNVDSGNLRTIATLRGGAPLLIERTDGPGRALLFLTTTARPPDASEGWTNLSVSPVFPVLVNEIVAYLAAPRLKEVPIFVGDNWAKHADGESFTIQSLEGEEVDSSMKLAEQPGLFKLTAISPTETSSQPPITLAVNVDPSEGELSLPELSELRRQFAGGGVSVTPVSELLRQDEDSAQASIYRLLGLGMLGLLLIEQLLAVACSYHQSSKRRAAGVTS